MGGGSGILPMITAQRDRFKKRNAQLEQELSESHKSVSQLRQEIAALREGQLEPIREVALRLVLQSSFDHSRVRNDQLFIGLPVESQSIHRLNRWYRQPGDRAG